jgi:hypothetical protein
VGHLIGTASSRLSYSTIMTNQNLSEPANGKEHPHEQEELEEGDEDALADVAASGVLDKISSDSC